MILPGALPLSLSLAGLDAPALGIGRAAMLASTGRSAAPEDGAAIVREVIEAVRGWGLAGVQIDATVPGVRARDLDRSARRDLASLLRRSEVACSGLEFFIPPEHFLGPQTVDRAVAGVVAAVSMCADLASLASGSVASRAASGTANVSVRLPPGTPNDVLAAISGACENRGVRLADHAWPARTAGAGSAIGVGIDPGAVLSAGADPAREAATLGENLVCARLTDALRSAPQVRAAPGSAGALLDFLAYRVALQTGGYRGHVLLDLRGLPNHAQAIEVAQRAWANADPLAPPPPAR